MICARKALKKSFVAVMAGFFFHLWPPVADAVEKLTLTIENQGKEYTVNLQATLQARPVRVFAVLSDYGNWHQLSELVTESKVIGSVDEHRHLVRSVASACVLMFCGKVIQVQDIVDRDGREILARTLPEHSNVRSGMVHWRIMADTASTTRIYFHMRITPDFWIPPLLGPWLIKRSLHSAAVNTVATIEKLANPDEFPMEPPGTGESQFPMEPPGTGESRR